MAMPRGVKPVLLVGVLVLAAVSATGLNAARQASPTPFDLFKRMIPVMRHPRCNNCHGVVDPTTGKNHHGGKIITNIKDPAHKSCDDGECHSGAPSASEWQIPSAIHFFDGRTDLQICNQVADFVSTFGRAKFITDHATRDYQIKQAWDGLAGDARVPGDTQPDGTIAPPADPVRVMSHAEFIQAAADWINQGNAACALDGTITWQESITSDETFPLGPTVNRMSQTGSRTVNISLVNGQYRADISVRGEIARHHTLKAGGCNMTTIITDTYSGHTTGPAVVTIKDTAFMFPRPVPPQADYRIDIILPLEQTSRTTITTAQNDCGVPIPVPPTRTEKFDWPAWTYTIEGRVQDVRAPSVVGGCSKTVLVKEVATLQRVQVCNRFPNMGNADNPWLVNHGGFGTYHDSTSIPIHVDISWNIRRR